MARCSSLVVVALLALLLAPAFVDAQTTNDKLVKAVATACAKPFSANCQKYLKAASPTCIKDSTRCMNLLSTMCVKKQYATTCIQLAPTFCSYMGAKKAFCLSQSKIIIAKARG